MDTNHRITLRKGMEKPKGKGKKKSEINFVEAKKGWKLAATLIGFCAQSKRMTEATIIELEQKMHLIMK